jgi:hypothetical protein
MAPVKEYQYDRALRIITILLWIPSFAFLLPYGIDSSEVFPALGIVPMTVSAFVSILHLYHLVPSPKLSMMLEFACGLFQIGFLIPSWAIMSSGYMWGGKGLVMLGSYGTAPMMIVL